MTKLIEVENKTSAVQTPNNQHLSMSPSVMNMLMQYTNMFAEASIVPDHYRGRKGDIFIAVQTAHRMNLDPMSVMQGTYVIHGKLGMNSAFAISLANTSGLLKSGISYKVEGEGDVLKVTAKAILKASGAEISYTIGMKEAKAEGWVEKKGSKYKTMPELMLRYRAATLLIRTHIPQVINGMHMVDEIEDVRASKSVQVVNASSSEERKVNVVDDFLVDDSQDRVEEEKVIEGKASISFHPLELQNLIESHDIPQEQIDKWCKKAGVTTIEELPEDKKQLCIDYILKNAQSEHDTVNNIEE